MKCCELSKNTAKLEMISVVLFIASGFSPVAANAKDDDSKSRYASGQSLVICKDCPEFVSVPEAPADLRRIRYVSKFELTWRNYLEAVDADACKIPRPFRPGLDSDRIKIADEIVKNNIKKYRIDWPVVMLSIDDIECYRSWLQKRTPYKIVLPTEKEWEWFARAGRQSAKFPWGEDVSPSHEALLGAKISYKDEIAIPDIYEIRATPVGVRVGLFPPNEWGLYDIMGNAREITDGKISASDWRVAQPSGASPGSAQNKYRTTLKGSDRYSADWMEGIAQRSYSIVLNGRGSADAGVRFILID